VLELEVLLLLRNTRITQISSEERALYLRKKDISYILILAYKSTTCHISCIGSGRMTISLVSRILDSDNMDFVETEH
ncbi:MAG: hypothetical protein WBD56_14960, partial [Anaerolineales bacterium]